MIPTFIAFSFHFSPNTMIPAAAEIPINPLGDISFIMIFRDPKYTPASAVVIIVAVESNEAVSGLLMQ